MRYTTIRVDEGTWNRVKAIKGIGESMGDAVVKLLDEHDAPVVTLGPLTVELTAWEHEQLMKHREERRRAVLNGKPASDVPVTAVDQDIVEMARETGVDVNVLRREHRRIMQEQMVLPQGAFHALKQMHQSAAEKGASG